MKPILLLVLMAALAAAPSFSQVPSQPVCGTPLVSNRAAMERAWQNTLSKFPDAASWSRQRTTPSFVLGAVDTFWVYNFASDQFERVPAELKAVGSVSYIWVATSELVSPPGTSNPPHIDSVVVQKMLEALETKTPAASKDSTKGIVVLDRQYFGNPPNIGSNFTKGAGDGKTHFLICDIKDSWTPTAGGSYIAGFFYNVDVDPFTSAVNYSNRRDMLYIDSYPGIFLNNTRDPERPLGTLAHEFQHLIHWNYDPSEVSFFNEGLSEYASYVCGFGLRSPAGYFGNTNIALLGWSSTLEDYSRGALWTLYLAEQYGDTFIRDFVQNPLEGITGFESSLSQAGISSSFPTTVSDFYVANVLQNRSVDPAFGYRDTIAAEGRPRLFKNVLGPVASGSRTNLAPLGVDYIRYFDVDTLTATLQSSGAVAARAVKTTDTQTTVSDFSLGSAQEITFTGSNSSGLTLVVQNTGAGGAGSYTFSSQGVPKSGAVFELAHDDRQSQTSPNQLLQSGDTLFVWFEGVEGGKIDSVAMWYASTGSARMLVRDYNANYDFNASPLTGLGGRVRMAGSPPAFTVTDTGYMKTVVHLDQYNIRSSPDFVVEVIYGPDAYNPMLRRDTSQSTIHSYLYLGSQPTAGRTMYTSFGDFYLRVYLSPAGDLPPSQVPEQFTLLQNYPNPFNPSTTIMYDLPERSKVRLLVYDILGRVVSVLKDEEEDANRYVVSFDGARLPSGVYFYRLETPAFTQTRKMVLLH